MAATHVDCGNNMRFRSGVIDYAVFKTHADHEILVGDLVYVDPSTGIAYPASSQADGNSLTANQQTFALYFAGVAMSKEGLMAGETSFKLSNDRGYVVVATSGDFEFPCDATSFVTGNLVGAVEQGATTRTVGQTSSGTYSGTRLEDQKVAKVLLEKYAIGIAKVPYNAIGTSMTSVLVSLRSQTMRQDVGSGQ